MKILATIAARGGSRGVKNKNIRELAGKPLIVYTIEQVKKWGGFEKFIVSTDSQAIADIAAKSGVDVPFMRPDELATDSCGKQEVLRHALKECEKYYGIEFDALLDLDITSPIRTVKDIEGVVQLYKEKQADCVLSAVKARKNPYFNMVEIQKDGFAVLSKRLPQAVKRRQDAPKVYEINASIYMYNRKFLLDERNSTCLAGKTILYEMDDLSAVDIDREIDFKFVEFLMKAGIVDL